MDNGEAQQRPGRRSLPFLRYTEQANVKAVEGRKRG